jgi:hypothetical protein
MRRALLATFVTAGGLLLAAAPAAGQSVADIPVDKVVRDAPGSVHLVGTDTVDPDDVGRACEVSITAGNNESVHPNTDFLISSGSDQMVVPDIEREAFVTVHKAGTLVLGDTVTVHVRLGPDGVFSGGFTISIASPCQPPDTTTAPTTTAPQDVTPTPESSAPVVAGQAERAQGGGSAAAPTLPRTGPSTGAVVAGAASLLAGLGLLAGVRRRPHPTD